MENTTAENIFQSSIENRGQEAGNPGKLPQIPWTIGLSPFCEYEVGTAWKNQYQTDRVLHIDREGGKPVVSKYKE